MAPSARSRCVSVTAWAAEQRLVLGMRRAPKRSEVTAAREIIALLDLTATTVTADALHGNRVTAAAIRARGGDYALAIKGNRGPMHRDAVALLADPDPALAARTSETAHGRHEERSAWVLPIPPDWAERHRFDGLAAMARIDSLRRVGTHESRQTRYFALSRRLEPTEALHVVRAHWTIENNQHWLLDVALAEDARRRATTISPRTSPSCAVSLSTCCAPIPKKPPCAKKSNARDGRTPTSSHSFVKCDSPAHEGGGRNWTTGLFFSLSLVGRAGVGGRIVRVAVFRPGRAGRRAGAGGGSGEQGLGARQRAPAGGRARDLPVLDLTLVWNRGITFGLLGGARTWRQRGAGRARAGGGRGARALAAARGDRPGRVRARRHRRRRGRQRHRPRAIRRGGGFHSCARFRLVVVCIQCRRRRHRLRSCDTRVGWFTGPKRATGCSPIPPAAGSACHASPALCPRRHREPASARPRRLRAELRSFAHLRADPRYAGRVRGHHDAATVDAAQLQPAPAAARGGAAAGNERAARRRKRIWRRRRRWPGAGGSASPDEQASEAAGPAAPPNIRQQVDQDPRATRRATVSLTS